jgi:hypothetical protein
LLRFDKSILIENTVRTIGSPKRHVEYKLAFGSIWCILHAVLGCLW